MIERLKEGVTEFVILTNHRDRAPLEVISFAVTAKSSFVGKHRTPRVLTRIESKCEGSCCEGFRVLSSWNA